MNQYDDEFEQSSLRRNRGYLIFCSALFFLLAGMIAFDWKPLPVSTSPLGLFNSSNADEIYLDPDGDATKHWILANCGNRQNQVAVLNEGVLHGSSSLSSQEEEELSRWCRFPIVTHPDIQSWSQQMGNLQALAEAPGTSAVEIMQSSLSVPYTALYVNPMLSWLDANPGRGKELLNAIAANSLLDQDIQRNMRLAFTARNNMNQVLGTAIDLAKESGQATDRDISHWLDAKSISENPRLLEKLIANAATDSIVRTKLLDSLRHLRRADRGDFYITIGKTLIDDPFNARQLRKQLKLLPSRQRLDIALQLIDSSTTEGSTAFTHELLTNIGEVFSGTAPKLEAFVALAELTRNNDHAAEYLTRQLRLLNDKNRRLAAIELMKFDRADTNDFTLQVLRRFNQFHAQSQPLIIEAILSSRQFQNPAVQAAVLDAIEDYMGNEARRSALLDLSNHRLLGEGIAERVKSL